MSERDAHFMAQGVIRSRNEVLELLEVMLDGKLPANMASIRLRAIGELISYQNITPHLNNKLLKTLVDIFNLKSPQQLPNIFENDEVVSARIVVTPDPSGVSAVIGAQNNDFFPCCQE
jgi:hypothetical protein